MIAWLFARWGAARLAGAAASTALEGWGKFTWLGIMGAVISVSMAIGAFALGTHDARRAREVASGARSACDAGISRANAQAASRALLRAQTAEANAAEERTRADALEVIARRAATELAEKQLSSQEGQDAAKVKCLPADLVRMINR